MRATNRSFGLQKLAWIAASVAAYSSLVAAQADVYSETIKIVNGTNGCTTLIHNLDPMIHKTTYTIGVYSSEGDAVAYHNWNLTFAEYLTATAGQRFEPPIQFRMVPVTLSKLMDMASEEEVDFSFASSAVSSCMATEFKAQPLVTVVNRRESYGRTYDLDVYGGVMFTLATNKDINTVDDFKDRVIGVGGITMMGGGQSQFYELSTHGISYTADPKQVIFTNDERATVQGLLDGDFEVAFARTDQIERHTDANGNLLDPDTFKVINPQTHVLDDGRIFPFRSSTSLHPEWPVAALDHVSKDVSKEVQEALLAVQDHATFIEMKKNLRCETTTELANLSLQAKTSGMYTAFRTARSYFEVRNKQEAAGFLTKTSHGNWHCIRGDNLYEDIQCPDQYYKLSKEGFDMSCELIGLECKSKYQCFCKPCVQAFEVDVFQYKHDTSDTEVIDGCKKMSLCGQIEQTKVITFRAIDHLERKNAVMRVAMHSGDAIETVDVHKVLGQPWTYEYHWSSSFEGVEIMEIFVNDVQIPQSPIRVQVIPRDCDADFPGSKRVSSNDGTCVCRSDTVDIRGNCVNLTVFPVTGSIGGLFIIAFIGYCIVRYKNHKNDSIWQVNVDELHFDDPVEVIGEGSFGVVLLAEYRGTKVAIKRAIRGNKTKGSTKGSKVSKQRNSTKATNGDSREDASSIGSDDPTPESMEEFHNENSTTDKRIGDVEAGVPSVSRVSFKASSFGFLDNDFRKHTKWAWLCPWWRKNDYETRFRDAVLGSASMSKTSLASRICPWFDAVARDRRDFVTEMRVLSRLRHPCITTVMGAVLTSGHVPMLVMEYMENGSLHDLLRNETMYMTGEIITQICRDIVQGMRYLHSSRPPILHGDLKARNILIDSRLRAKICDFGLSTKKKNVITGTPFWLAPEYLRGQSDYSAPCDMYSIGIIFFEIYARANPYEGEVMVEVLRKVCNRQINKRPAIPSTTPNKMADIMKKCWSPDPASRPQAKDLDLTLIDMSVTDAEPLTVEQQNLRTQRPRKELLYEIFPKHIADALKNGKKVEPESHDLVTIVFSDIVHFTDISVELPPLKVSNMLDRLYLAFDTIADKHGVFKVETIGDAYMGVTNLEGNHDDSHVKRIAEFAIEMITEANKILIDEDDPARGFVSIRVGFHSGPVVSNVIGSLNPRYGLFGDTVNTANRMESNSRPNRINCSEKSYRLLKEQAPHIPARLRGKIDVKGKGEMTTYWIGSNLTKAKKQHEEEDKRHVVFDCEDLDSYSNQPVSPGLVENLVIEAEGTSTKMEE